MLAATIILILILCFVLGFFILVQKPKGSGLSGTFGSLGAQVMGVQKSGDTFEKGTWVLMAVIGALCIASTMFIPNRVVPTTGDAAQQEQTQQGGAAQEQPQQEQPAPAQ